MGIEWSFCPAGVSFGRVKVVQGEVSEGYRRPEVRGATPIAGMSVGSQDVIAGGANAPPAMESVTFTFETITWTYELDGSNHTDTWAGP